METKKIYVETLAKSDIDKLDLNTESDFTR
jgi:hypothetical protein